MLRSLAAAADRRKGGAAPHKRACSAPADQATATAPPVVVTPPVPGAADLSLFAMRIEAQVAAAGIEGAKDCGFEVGVMSFWNMASFVAAGTQQQKRRSPTHRCSQRRRTLTSSYRYRPCRLRRQSRNTRRRCKAIQRTDAMP